MPHRLLTPGSGTRGRGGLLNPSAAPASNGDISAALSSDTATSLPPALRGEGAGRHPLPPEVRQAHQRNHVLSAAPAAFAARGYHATTVDGLAAAAHVGVGTFYALFDGREDCFLQALDRTLAAAFQRLADSLPADTDWQTQVTATLAAARHFIEAEPAQARLLLLEAQTAGPAALQRYEACVEQAAEFLRRGRALAPHGSELPDSLEFTLITGVAWVLGQRAAEQEAGSLEQLCAELANFLLEPYLATRVSSAP